jgi:hypothetical protein
MQHTTHVATAVKQQKKQQMQAISNPVVWVPPLHSRWHPGWHMESTDLVDQAADPLMPQLLKPSQNKSSTETEQLSSGNPV